MLLSIADKQYTAFTPSLPVLEKYVENVSFRGNLPMMFHIYTCSYIGLVRLCYYSYALQSGLIVFKEDYFFLPINTNR